MQKETREKKIVISDDYLVRELFGSFDKNIKIIENELNVDILSREGEIRVIGEEENVKLAEMLIKKLVEIINKEGKLTEQNINYMMRLVCAGKGDKINELLDDTICVTSTGKMIKPKTLGQRRYINSIRKNDIVFGIGPAGTGKTYLAMAMAISSFKNKEVNRIILTRPAVEAGESLGFLPGDLQEKVDPYLRPLYDALFDILGVETFTKYMEKGLIEIAPLAYMRGRTLDSSYVILDEAQNTTSDQMKMFLTRLGFGSKAIITGDITQIDLPKGKSSGLIKVADILKDIKGIGFVYLDKNDVVRHRLVQRIIEAYDHYEKGNNENR